MEQEVYSRALKASRDQEEHRTCSPQPEAHLVQGSPTSDPHQPLQPQLWPFSAPGNNPYKATANRIKASHWIETCSMCSPAAFPKLPQVFPAPHICSCIFLLCFLYAALIGFTRCVAITKHWRVTGTRHDWEETGARERFTTASRSHKAKALGAATAGAMVAPGALHGVPTVCSCPLLTAPAKGTREAGLPAEVPPQQGCIERGE